MKIVVIGGTGLIVAGLVHVVSPIAKRRPDRKSSRWPEFRM